MEKSLEDLNRKIKALKFRIGKSDDIIAKGDREALERQRLSVGAISSMVNTLKEAIEENMFSLVEQIRRRSKDMGPNARRNIS